jgi:anti-anti-sigma regulatory factor
MDIATNDSMDPVLEVSIDDRGTPVIVQLVRALDHTTRAWLSSRMEKPLIDGVRDFVMDLERAFVDASGAMAMVLIQRRVRESGGTLLREGVRLTLLRGDVQREPAMGYRRL